MLFRNEEGQYSADIGGREIMVCDEGVINRETWFGEEGG